MSLRGCTVRREVGSHYVPGHNTGPEENSPPLAQIEVRTRDFIFVFKGIKKLDFLDVNIGQRLLITWMTKLSLPKNDLYITRHPVQ